jgi:hypothetical protein
VSVPGKRAMAGGEFFGRTDAGQRLGIGVHAVVEWNGEAVRSVKKSFAAAVKAAGLPTEGPDKITPHVLRHTAATWMMRNGVNTWKAAGFLGMSEKVLIETYGMKDAAIDVYVAATYGWLERGAADGSAARPTIESDEDEPRDVTADGAQCFFVPHELACAPRGPQQSCGIRTGQPCFAPGRLGRQDHADNFRAIAFLPMIIDGRSQILKFATRHRLSDWTGGTAGLIRLC